MDQSSVRKVCSPDEDYLVSPKVDGVRYLLMYFSPEDGGDAGVTAELKGRCILVDRALKAYSIPAPWATCHTLLLDGELVRLEDGHVIYVVFDVLYAAGIRLPLTCPLEHRLAQLPTLPGSALAQVGVRELVQGQNVFRGFLRGGWGRGGRGKMHETSSGSNKGFRIQNPLVRLCL